MNWVVKNMLPEDCLGRGKELPSVQMLKHMAKDELIDQIHIAQENYASLLYLYERACELQEAMYKEATDKGVDFECLKARYDKES